MRLCWPLLSLLAITSCSPKQILIQVRIITTSCEAKTDPFEGVQFLRVRVTGDGIDVPLDSVAPTGSMNREITIPDIPAGKNRIIDVRGYSSDPTMGGMALSVGRSLPFEVADVIPDPTDNLPIPVTVFLRKVNAFTRPSAEGTPNECQNMKVARAGHTATVLKDGRVFIAGGYNFTQGSTAQVSLSETEVFNPDINAFESSPRMAIGSGGTTWIPKAFHTATRLASGQVLLWGGETYTSGVNNYPAPAAIILVFDPDFNEYGAVPNRSTPAAIPRRGHQAILDANGKVLVVGGETRTASPPAALVPADQVEFFDPATNLYKVVDAVTMPRMQTAAIAVRGGEFVAVVGGTDGTMMGNEVAFFKWNEVDGGTTSAFKRETIQSPPRLAEPGRRAAAVATLRDGADLLVMGGYSDFDLKKYTPVASSEIVATSTSTVSPGPSVGSSGPGGRGDICAVQLADGKILAIGGRTVDATGPETRSDGSTVIISANSSGGASGIGGPALSIPRYHHTCTALKDGTVLVVGGVNEQPNGMREILNDAWIYQPAPTTP
jgi:hypothetical protein